MAHDEGSTYLRPLAVQSIGASSYIHAGLFSPLETDDQLAAVISHEIAHITQKHSVKAIISQKNTLIGAHIGDFATGGFGLVYFGAFANIMHFSRAQESEADKVGIVLLSDSGYQPKAMLEIYKSMANLPGLEHRKSSIYSSHPSNKLRIRDLEGLVAAHASSNGVEETTSLSFVTIKGRMIEDSLKIRLRQREYNLAQVLVEQASAYFGDTSKVDFYLGEVYRGFYRYPEDAAREKYWIDTGKHKLNEAYAMKFEAERPANLKAAIGYYKAAVEKEPPYPKAFKRLGEICEQEQWYQQAVDYFIMYLDQSPDASDRTYVNLALDRLKKKVNGDLQ